MYTLHVPRRTHTYVLRTTLFLSRDDPGLILRGIGLWFFFLCVAGLLETELSTAKDKLSAARSASSRSVKSFTKLGT
jgi:hypothetical protein